MSIKITKKYILPSAASREPMRFLALCPLREGRIYDEWNKIKKKSFLLYFFQKYLKSYLSFIPFFFPNHMTHFSS